MVMPLLSAASGRVVVSVAMVGMTFLPSVPAWVVVLV
jgi:hypothetical protein